MSEQFICINCKNIGPLNPHGKCEKCDSESVVSVERLTALTTSQTKTRTKLQPSLRNTLYEVMCGPFRCTLYAENQYVAIRRACEEGNWHVQTPSTDLDVNSGLFYGMAIQAEPVKATQTLEQTQSLK